MTARSLREEVIAARTTRRMTAVALQRASGLSARTLRDIEAGSPTRRYSVTTLAALDRAFGWEPGHAWAAWQEGEASAAPPTSVEDIVEQMALLRVEVARRLDAGEVDSPPIPSWAVEVVDLMRLMTTEDRRRVLDLAQRLAPG